MKKLGIVIIFLAGVLSGCRQGCTDPTADNFKERAKKDDGSCVYSDNYDRGTMLRSYADLLIIPGYQNLEDKLNSLQSAIADFRLNPNTANLSILQDTWYDALLAWQHVAYFEFGPAEQLLLRSNLNTYPTDTNQILGNISSGSYDLDIVSNIDAKGLQAIDYLINGASSTEIVTLFSSDTHSQNRGQYLEDLATDMHSKTSATLSQWQSSYRSQFISNTGLDAGSSTNLLFNAFVMHYERCVRQGKLGIPAGALTLSQMALPDKVEAYYKQDVSVELLSEAMLALENIYKGNSTSQEGVGFEEYVAYLEDLNSEEALISVINSQLTDAQNAIGNMLQNPLSSFVENDQQTALQVWDEMQMLVVYFKNDLKSTIGLSITYADADGD